MKYDIGRDFSQVPAGRYPSDGDYSGEAFREQVLAPAIKNLQNGDKIEIVIDNVEGYGSSFLNEAFGGAVRKKYISSEQFLKVLKLEYADSDFDYFKDKIIQYIKDPKE
jgi:hypothetical protein